MKILIAVIAFNEAENIERTLNDLKNNAPDYDVIVIDDGSADDTVKIVKSLNIPIVSHCVNTGNAMETVKTYFNYAYDYNYDIVCQFDGDGQHIASELKKIIEPLKNNQADYVIGSRFLEKEGFQSSFLRRLGINLFSWIDSKIIGQEITDITSGFRAYNCMVINFFSRTYKYEIHDTSQLLLLSHFNGARIKEVPIVMKSREFGESEFHPTRAIMYILKCFINVLGSLLQRRKFN